MGDTKLVALAAYHKWLKDFRLCGQRYNGLKGKMCDCHFPDTKCTFKNCFMRIK